MQYILFIRLIIGSLVFLAGILTLFDTISGVVTRNYTLFSLEVISALMVYGLAILFTLALVIPSKGPTHLDWEKKK